MVTFGRALADPLCSAKLPAWRQGAVVGHRISQIHCYKAPAVGRRVQPYT